MVTQCWVGERQNRRRKEHGLIVGMRNEEAYSFVDQLGEGGLRDRNGVEPGCDCK